MNYMMKHRIIISCLSTFILLTMALSGCAQDGNSVTSQNSSPSQSESITAVESNTQTASTNVESSSTTNTTIPEVKSAIEIAKSKPVAELLTNITISNLSVTLGELFEPQEYYMAEWYDLDTMVKLCLKKESTSNMVIMTFSKIGNELDFPQVSTMIITNSGNEYIPWSFDNLDNALVDKLLSKGYIVNNGGYQVAG